MLPRDTRILLCLDHSDVPRLSKILSRAGVFGPQDSPLEIKVAHNRKTLVWMLECNCMTMADVIQVLVDKAETDLSAKLLLRKFLITLYPPTPSIPASSSPALARRIIGVHSHLLPHGMSSSAYLPGQTVADLTITLGLSYDTILEHESSGALVLTPSAR